MQVQGLGHWDGDPNKYCGRLAIRADTLSDASKLAALKRALSDPDRREALIDLARAQDEALNEVLKV